jgi:hexosaminidase
MEANKMNVLHFHLSDFCRFAVESKIFPSLTANLTGLQAGYYSQQDVSDLILYARLRGIRVVPEIDLPGHARGLLPLEAEGLQFCSSAESRSQLFDDPGNATFGVLKQLLTEMSKLFSDSVMNVGSDETRQKGLCTLSNTAGLESKVLATVQGLGKQPMAWVNALTTTKVATQSTILDTWATVYGMPDLVTKQGYQCVASTYMYLNHITGDAGNYTNYWRDIAPGVSDSAKHLMLGGEVSMWTDDYCYTHQCGASAGNTPVAARFYGPDADSKFSQSISGVLFPRASVGAGSFWNYQPGLISTSADFIQRMDSHNDWLAARGVDPCPSTCTCDTLLRCGKPY